MQYQQQDIVQSKSERNVGSWDCPQCTFTNEPYVERCQMCTKRAPQHVLVFPSMPPTLPFGVEIEIVIPNGIRDGFTLSNIATQLTTINMMNCAYGDGDCSTSILRVDYDDGRSMSSKAQHTYDNQNHNNSHNYNYHQNKKGRGIERQQTIYSNKNRSNLYDGYIPPENWKIVADSSLYGNHPQNDLCFELISPILMAEDGLQQLRIVMENLRSLGIATNTSCGFHVHVDASTYSLRSLQQLANCFLALENAFDLLVASNSTIGTTRRANQNRYCKSNRLPIGQASNRQRWDRISATRNIHQLVHLICPDRYRKLNLRNLLPLQHRQHEQQHQQQTHRQHARPTTIEFRQHGGIETIREAESWIRLVLRFVHRVTSTTPGSHGIISKCLLPQGSQPKDELCILFYIVDHDENDQIGHDNANSGRRSVGGSGGGGGLQQYYVSEKRLFQDTQMTNTWPCNVCHRIFGDSRALSQHRAATKHR